MAKKDACGGLVYSTEYGRMCPLCLKPHAKCQCPAAASTGNDGDGIVRVGRETKGRKGKGVTIISGVSGGDEDLRKLCSELKTKCGCGGTVKNGIIEIQGDNRDKIIELLKSRGLTVKRTGG